MLRKAIPIALVLLVFGLLPSCAQEFSFRSFGGTEGLRNLAIRGIYQDRAGFLWASTEDGIFRYVKIGLGMFSPLYRSPRYRFSYSMRWHHLYYVSRSHHGSDDDVVIKGYNAKAD